MININPKQILKGTLWYFIYKLNLLPDAKKDDLERKMAICDKCPLKSGIFCSSKKQLMTYEKVNGSWTPIRKTGCGCIRMLKALSTDPCPIGKW